MKNKVLSFILTAAMLVLAVAPLVANAEVPTDVPLPTTLTVDTNATDGYVSSDGSMVYYYTGVKSSDYTSYIETLRNAEYTQLQTYTADDCNYALLDNGKNTVFVSFLRSVSGTSRGRLRVFVQASGTAYHTVSVATAEGKYAPMLWQLDVDNLGGDNGGMSYVIRLSDGTFVIVDGGYKTDAEATNLYNILKANNPLGDKPVISAWFITHLHSDHYGVLANFANLYSNKVKVKGFYYNFPGQDIGDIYVNNVERAENTMKRFEGATLYSKLHSGMVMGFAGATVEVLSTHEDIKQSYYYKERYTYEITANDFESANDTSTVIRLNIKGQKILFLADANDGIGDALMNTHNTSYLKSDIMQMAHHGFSDGVSYKVIEAINPKVILWPMDVVRYDKNTGEMIAGENGDTKTFAHYYNLTDTKYVESARDCASEIIPAYRNEKLALPYTANTIYSSKSETVDINAAIAAKMDVSAVTKDIYVQKSLDNTKIRFIGVVNIDEADFDKYSSFGFDIALVYNGKTYKNSFTTTTLYTSLVASGQTVYANQYGGTSFYAIEITGIELENSTVEFIINGTGAYSSGSNQISLTYDTRTYVVTPELTSEANGTIPSIDFSEIIAGAWN